jgi:hypothetical protein
MIRKYKHWFINKWAQAANFDAEGRWRIRWPTVLFLMVLEAIVPFAAVAGITLTMGETVGIKECIMVAVIVGWFALERLLPDPDRDPRLKKL